MVDPTEDRPARRLSESTAAFLAYALLLLAVHGRPLLRGEALLPTDLAWFFCEPWRSAPPPGLEGPGNPALTDPVFALYPWAAETARSLADGRLPTWNPYAFAGNPLLANLQPAVFFPPWILLLALAGPVHALGLTALLCALFGAFTLHLFLRARGLGFLPALLGGIVHLLCGFSTAWFLFPLYRVACFLPLLLLLADRLARRRDAGSALLLALAVAAQFLGSHVETSLHVLLAAGLYLVARWIAEARTGARGVAAALAVGAGVVLAGALLAAAQLLPFFEALFQSEAWAERIRTRGAPRGLVPAGFLALLVPDVFGHPGRGGFQGPNNWCELMGTAGVLPLLLAPIGALRAARRSTWVFVLLALGSLTLAYELLPVRRLVGLLPGFNVAANTRVLYLFDLSIAVLAAEGLAALLGSPTRPRAAVVTGRLALLAGAAVTIGSFWAFLRYRLGADPATLPRAWAELAKSLAVFAAALVAGETWLLWGARLPRAAAGALACLLAAGELAWHARGSVPATPPGRVLPETASLRWLREHRTDPATGARVRVLPVGDALPPNLATLFELHDPRGYDPMGPRLARDLERRARLLDVAWLTGRSFRSPLLDLLGVRYVATARPVPGLSPVHEADLCVYENERALPRAFVVERWRTIPEEARLLEELGRDDFDPRAEALVAEDPWPGGPPPASPGPAAEVRIEEERADAIRLRVTNPRPGLLVLADTWFPGWEVSVGEGPRLRPLRVDHALRGVLLRDAGTRVVTFRYRPWTLTVGLALSGLTAAATLALAVRLALRRRRKP